MRTTRSTRRSRCSDRPRTGCSGSSSSAAPVYAARDKLALAYWLGKLREELGADDPTVRAVLGKDTPEQVAARLVDGTKLSDSAERMRLWKGGKAAVAASRDPMIALAKQV